MTRPVEQADELAIALVDRGVEPVTVPTVAIDRDTTGANLDGMLAGLDGADWLVLTSANGVRALATRLRGRSLPDRLRVAAVGPATADALNAAGIRVDYVPEEYLTTAIADGLGDVEGRRVVLARADTASRDLARILLRSGALVEEVVAYRTVEGPAASRDLLHACLNDDLAGICFTSGSTVRGLARLASPLDRHRARALPAFCIGPVTAAVARSHGFAVSTVATNHTARGLADSVAAHFAKEEW